MWVLTSNVMHAELVLPKLKYQTETFSLQVNVS